jgi:hypothetical protein
MIDIFGDLIRGIDQLICTGNKSTGTSDTIALWKDDGIAEEYLFVP